jgi:hypothetical protein
MEGLILPTTTTVNVEGSLKHRLKKSHALMGFTFFKSPILIGCIIIVKKYKKEEKLKAQL